MKRGSKPEASRAAREGAEGQERFTRDRVLRQLARTHPESLGPVVEALRLSPKRMNAVEVQAVGLERYPDALIRVVDHRNQVRHVHVEFETKADATLPWRLAVTHVVLSTADTVGGSREHPAPRLSTVVVWLGAGKAPSGELRVEDRLVFRYEVIGLHEIPARELARRPATAALTPLGARASAEALRLAARTLGRIRDGNEKKELSEAMMRLTRVHLGRKMEKVARNAMSEAGIPINDFLLYKEGREEGREEGRRQGLVDAIELTLKGRGADAATLDKVSAMLESWSLDELQRGLLALSRSRAKTVQGLVLALKRARS